MDWALDAGRISELLGTVGQDGLNLELATTQWFPDLLSIKMTMGPDPDLHRDDHNSLIINQVNF